MGEKIRLSASDVIAVGAFLTAIVGGNVASGASWPVWLGSLGATGLGVWQIRQGNVSETGIRARLEIDLAARNRQLSEANISEALRQAVGIMAFEPGGTRANVMLIGDDQRLYIAYHHNMTDAPDHGVRFDKYQGCAGHAWALAEQAIADLGIVRSEELRTTWKLTTEQVTLTSHIKSMICTPILHPGNDDKIIGVLCVDSADALAKSGLGSDETAEEALAVSKVIGRLLLTGGII